MLGPLFFNIYLVNLFILVKDTNIASYADDNTMYVLEKDVVKGMLENNFFGSKYGFKANQGKSHLLLNNTT